MARSRRRKAAERPPAAKAQRAGRSTNRVGAAAPWAVLFFLFASWLPAGEPEEKSSLPVPVKLSAKITDPDGDVVRLEWTQVEGEKVVLREAHTAEPSFIPARPGVYAFEVRAFDGKAWSEPKRVRVVVKGPNHPPVGDAGKDQEVDLGAEVFVDGRGSRDPDGDEIRFSWTQLASGAPRVPLSRAQLSSPAFRFRPEAPGRYVFQLGVVDLDGAAAVPVQTTVTVLPPNQAPRVALDPEVRLRRPALIFGPGPQGTPDANRAPSAHPGKGRTITLGEWLTLDGSGSRDPDGGALAGYWEQIAGPEEIREFRAVQPGNLVWKCRPRKTGRYTFRLVVDDGAIQVSSPPVSFVVLGGRGRPVADAGPDAVAERGVSCQLNGSRSFDPDGDPLTFCWKLLSGPPVRKFSLDTALKNPEAQPAFVPEELGAYVFQLTVFDGKLWSLPDVVKITVVRENRAPAVEAPETLKALVGETVKLAGRGADPDGDELAFCWLQLEGPSVKLVEQPGARGRIAAFTAEKPGYCLFQFTAYDGRKTSPAAYTQVGVKAESCPPTAHIVAPVRADAGTKITLDGSCSPAPAGGELRYRWKLLSGPAGSRLEGRDRPQAALWVPSAGQVRVALKVSDGICVSAPAFLVLEVEDTLHSQGAALEAPPDVEAGAGTWQVKARGFGADGPVWRVWPASAWRAAKGNLLEVAATPGVTVVAARRRQDALAGRPDALFAYVVVRPSQAASDGQAWLLVPQIARAGDRIPLVLVGAPTGGKEPRWKLGRLAGDPAASAELAARQRCRLLAEPPGTHAISVELPDGRRLSAPVRVCLPQELFGADQTVRVRLPQASERPGTK